MVEIYSQINKNRLYIILKGKFDNEGARQVAEKVVSESRKLKPGFGTISDLTEFVTSSEQERLIMMDAMAKLKQSGMGHVVRINTNFIASNQWQRTSRAVGYSAAEATCKLEAEKLLDKMEGR